MATAALLAVHGPTLTLRLPVLEDAPALLDLAGDPEVTRWFSWGPYTDLAQPRGYIERQAQRREDGVQLDLVVEHREAGPVGVIGLSELSARDRRAMVGTWFGRDWWGTGVNTEAKALVFHLGFGACGLVRIGAYSDVANARSRTALSKVGLVHEGILRGWHRHGEQQKDVNVHGLLRADWMASRLFTVPARVEGAVPAAFVVG
ncbi:MAG: family N-acetyltransferase [Solirubrobacterales bacterium]|nr:family N-acetyltransferase [Solirubrobacterales bacterium]